MLELIQDSSTFSLVLTALIIVLITVLLFVLKNRPKSKKYVLLTGITNSGKTSIYCQLVYKQNLLTQISIAPNVGVASLDKTSSTKEKKFDVVDIPGQDKVRGKFFEMYKKSVRAIVFVVDSSAYHKEAKDVALFLYDIISDPFIAKSKARILILCNKQDVDLAKGEKYIKSSLEKEIELLRKISSSALESTAGSKGSGEGAGSKSGMHGLTKGDKDKQFEFADLKYNRVEFCEASGASRDNLTPLFEWLSANI